MERIRKQLSELWAVRKGKLLMACGGCMVVIIAMIVAMGIGAGKDKSNASLTQRIDTSVKSTTGYIPHTLYEIEGLPTSLQVVSGSAITVSGTNRAAEGIASEDLASNTVTISKDFGPSKPGTQRIYGYQDVYRGNLDATLTIQLISTTFQDTASGLNMSIFGQDQRPDKRVAVYYKAGSDTNGTYAQLNNYPKALSEFATRKELLDKGVPYEDGTIMNYIIVVWSIDNGTPENNQSGDNRYQASGTEETFSFTVDD